MLPQSLLLEKNENLSLSKLFVELTMYKKGLNENVKENITIENIFDKVKIGEKEYNSRRILLEGHPGYGKTTLLYKLLQDWSNDKGYLKERFNLVFGIILRNFRDNSLSINILEQCNQNKAQKEAIERLIKGRQTKILILLDGLDEASDETKESILSFLERKEYPDMTAVVTCRTGHSYIETNFENASIGLNTEQIWDKKIQINGLSAEKRNEFLCKYFDCDEEKLKKKLFDSQVEVTDLYHCPLFLLLLAILIKENKINDIGTKTKLYKIIFNFIIKRSINRENINIQIPSSIFESPDSLIYKMLEKFGKLCVDKILGQRLIFHENEIVKQAENENILKLGFLSKPVTFFVSDKNTEYETIHRTFMEFLAAFYLSSLNENELKNKLQELGRNGILPKKDEFLYPFLGGFLQYNSDKIFTALISWNFKLSVLDESLSNIFLEIPKDEKIIKSLKLFIPEAWFYNSSFFSYNDWHIDLLKYYQHHIKEIYLIMPKDMKFFSLSPDKLRVENLILEIKKEIYEEVTTELKEKQIRLRSMDLQITLKWIVKCKNLIVTTIDDVLEAKMFLETFKSNFQVENIWLKCDYCNSSTDIEIKKKNFIKLQELQTLHCLSLTDVNPYLLYDILPLIKDLISSKKIKYGIEISLSNQFILGESIKDRLLETLNFISNQNISFLSFKHESSVQNFPISLEFSDPLHKWHHICIEGLFHSDTFTVKQFPFKQSDTFTVDCLETFDFFNLESVKQFADLIKRCNGVKKLIVSYSLLLKIKENFPLTWNGFQTVEKIEIIILNEFTVDSFVSFRTLKEVRLNFLPATKINSDKNFLESIYNLTTLRKLDMRSESIEIDKCFLKCISELAKQSLNKKVSLEEIRLVFYIYNNENDYKSLSENVTSCLVNKVFHKFSFASRFLRSIQDYTSFIQPFLINESFEIRKQFEDVNSSNLFPSYHSSKLFLSKPREFISITYNIKTRLAKIKKPRIK